jgi:hypoxanthine phosphoribosyltransferase
VPAQGGSYRFYHPPNRTVLKSSPMSQLSQTIFFDRNRIQLAVEKVAWQVHNWLKSESAKGINLVSVLEGAKPFTRDLAAGLEKLLPGIELRIHEIKVLGTNGAQLLGKREWQSGSLGADQMGNHPVLIVDDLVDSGKTLGLLKEKISNLGFAGVKSAVLIRKFGPASGPVDFCGFELDLNREDLARKGLKDYWLYGYGMDLEGKMRELDHIGWVEIK